jgi:hypothetical protein
MKALIACEESGVVRDAFTALGHDAMSCDLLPTARPGNHYQGDVCDLLGEPWDILVAFPPCTHLASSGARWFKEKRADGRQAEGIAFFMRFTPENLPHIPRICIENPIGIMSSKYRKPDKIIQPWQFGHGETKATCLWLHGLPMLVPTDVVEGREQRIWRMPPGPDRAKLRSRTYQGIADAMATQWGR